MGNLARRKAPQERPLKWATSPGEKPSQSENLKKLSLAPTLKERFSLPSASLTLERLRFPLRFMDYSHV